MNCAECEVVLALEETSGETEAHLAGCASCRRVAAELAANSEALRAMSEDVVLLGSVRHRVMAKIDGRRRVVWASALAAAAMLVATIGVARQWHAVLPPEVKVAVAPPRIEIPGLVVEPATPEPLLVKMLTDDPDVVIYWLINGKEGTE